MARDWASEILGTGAAPQAEGEVIEAQAPRDWVGEITGAPTQRGNGIVKPNPDASKTNILRRAYDAIKGKQDPAYAHLKGFDIDAAGAPTILSTAGAAFGGADDKSYADVIQKSLGGQFKRRFQDANGYEIIEWTDGKGQTRQEYVNTPGLDLGDVQRGVGQALSYIGVGKLMGKGLQGAPLALRAAGQMGGAASTSVVGDISNMALGSEQGVDPKKAVVAGLTAGVAETLPGKLLAPVMGGVIAGGATLANDGTVGETATNTGLGVMAGVAANALIRRLVGMSPGLYVDNGKLTPKGEQVAVQAGLDPKSIAGDVADEFARTYAKTRNAATAGLKAQQTESGIPLSLGQRTKDYQQMVREDQMRAGLYGQDAKAIIDQFDREQQSATRNALLGGSRRELSPELTGKPTPAPPPPSTGPVPPPPPAQPPSGIAPQINPGNWRTTKPGELGQSIREGVREAREGGKHLD